MARTLGTFNRFLQRPRHPEDRVRRREDGPVKEPQATLGYTLGVLHNQPGMEEFTRSNAEKFVSGRTNLNRRSTGMRMAGVELRNQLAQM